MDENTYLIKNAYLTIKAPRIFIIGFAFIGMSLIACVPCQQSISDRKTLIEASQNHVELPDTVGKIARMVFDSTSYHYGTLKQGDFLQREIYFTNFGPGDLMIELISACECTTLDWSRLPIKPGSRSAIKVLYNSKDKEGPQIVDIEVIANTIPSSTFTKFFLIVNKL